MGMGDEIMAAGRAGLLYEQTGKPVAILDRHGARRWHSIWAGNPAIDRDAEQTIVDGVGVRGYIDGWQPGPRAMFKPNYCNADHPGRVYVPAELQQWAATLGIDRSIVIEPHVRSPSSPNKSWGFDRFAKVAEQLEGVVQLAQEPVELLPDARFIPTLTPMHAAAIIERAALTITVEGGTHHLAGATRRPAVVVYGAFIHPRTTGYAWHENLVAGDSCGRWDDCTHCREAMASITPQMVIDAADRLGVLE